MKDRLLKIAIVGLVLICIAAALPVKKFSDYPNITTSTDDTMLVLLADTNSSPTTNKSMKLQHLRASISNGITTAWGVGTNTVTTNIAAAATVQTNNVATNAAAALLAATNTLSTIVTNLANDITNRTVVAASTNLVASTASSGGVKTTTLSMSVDRTFNWEARTNAVINKLAGQVVLLAGQDDFWLTNSLAKTNILVFTTVNAIQTDQPYSVQAVPTDGLIHFYIGAAGQLGTNLFISFFIVP